jgi:hypothetical protein
MPDDHTIPDLPGALNDRSYPTVTSWNRLEGWPRSVRLDRALAAEVRDALWMLTKQWQVGEFRGDDAGSPCAGRLALSVNRLTRYRPGDGAAEPFDVNLPLDARVERRPIALGRDQHPMALDLRLLMGRQWLKLVAPIGDYREQYVRRYRVVAPDPTSLADAERCATADVWQSFAAAAGRCMDGGALYTRLTTAGGRASDGIVLAVDAHGALLDAAGERFTHWFDRLFHQPAPSGAEAWAPDRLEYAFALAAPTPAGETTYVAEEYAQARIDWYDLDVDRAAPPLGAGADTGEGGGALPSAETHALVPTQLAFEGMPASRWWAFEDRRTNFGNIDATTTDLVKLLLVEFALVYANDWFVIPCSVEAGSIVGVRGLAVSNVFGERLWIEPAGAGPDDAWQRWSMFTVNTRGASRADADTRLLLLPTMPKVQESRPLDEVLLLRDEVANMVWAIERVVPLATGATQRGAEAALDLHGFLEQQFAVADAPPVAPVPYAAPIAYRVMSTVPEEWIPFLPVHMPNDVRKIQLQRAAMPRILEGTTLPPARVRPRTELLRDGLDRVPPRSYFVHQEEVTRAGVRLTRTFRRTRWRDGAAVVWIGVRKETGRGEGSSRLAFDQLIDTG